MASIINKNSLTIKNVCVLGAGDMGHGIAESCAIYGYKVILYDIKEEFLESALIRIEQSLKILKRKRKIKKQNIADILLRFTLTTNFNDAVRDMPEITEAHRLAGDMDYILKIQVASTRAYDEFYKRLIAKVTLNSVTSCLSMETLKYETELPI